MRRGAPGRRAILQATASQLPVSPRTMKPAPGAEWTVIRCSDRCRQSLMVNAGESCRKCRTRYTDPGLNNSSDSPAGSRWQRSTLAPAFRTPENPRPYSPAAFTSGREPLRVQRVHGGEGHAGVDVVVLGELQLDPVAVRGGGTYLRHAGKRRRAPVPVDDQVAHHHAPAVGEVDEVLVPAEDQLGAVAVEREVLQTAEAEGTRRREAVDAPRDAQRGDAPVTAVVERPLKSAIVVVGGRIGARSPGPRPASAEAGRGRSRGWSIPLLAFLSHLTWALTDAHSKKKGTPAACTGVPWRR